MFVLRNNATGEHFVAQLAWSGGYCFEFDLDAAENEIELKNVRENNFSDYLILSKKNDLKAFLSLLSIW